MKRKVIQIADSTQLISLPRKWCLANNVKKGDELNVETEGQLITVSCKQEMRIERAELRMKDYGPLAPRVIYSLYRKGIDELKVYYDDPEEVQAIQKNLRDATGYEIVEQDSKSILIKNISSNIMGFDSMLRRTFLLLISQAEECAKAFSEKNVSALKNLVSLEESNNHFTTVCRRYLNKYEAPKSMKTGPLYSIVQEIEKIADEYKYLVQAIEQHRSDFAKTAGSLAGLYKGVSAMMREVYEVFYKFDPHKFSAIAEARQKIVEQATEKMKAAKSPIEFLMVHHLIVITQKAFNMLGSMIILTAPVAESLASVSKHQDI
ncbi:hypothetical protein C4580_00735 [Candidatus Woesearchaeota archaeon]|nr:MAG: hypothetical protein C4580_00735 [Candidatus Woesearchaeota archaeon]